MKFTNYILFSFILVTTAYAQPGIVDSFKSKLDSSKADTSRVNLLVAWAEYYNEDESDIVVMLSQQGVDLARKLHYSKGEVRCLVNMGNGYYGLGNYVKAVQVFQQAMTLSNEIDYPEGNMRAFGFYTLTYYLQGDFRRELSYHLHVEQQARKLNNLPFIIMGLGQAGKAYVELGILDSAAFYLNKTYLLLKQVQFNHPKAALFVTQLGILSRIQNQKPLALSYLRQAIPICMATNAKGRLTTIYLSIADIYKSDKQMDSALYYAKKAFLTAHENTFKFQNIARSGFWLSQIYDTMHNYQESMYYAKLATQASDSLLNQDKVNQITNMIFNEQLQQQQLKAAEDRYRNQIKFYASLAALVFFLIVGLTLYRNNKQNRQAKIKIEKAYEELKTTQSQLIQKEKMASLGELTAGIAHEIQNPLNFVNNFSEVSNELLDEMKVELSKKNYEDVNVIADNVKQNLEKINHHGKRADAIVKGMLQHSRSSNGIKEPTNINTLVDEYLRLAYHGLRAKDKSFNVALKTEYDETIGNISVIPQDVGRVFLNLITNAFYVVDEKKKQSDAGYEPTVAISTKKANGKVEIKVSDNGNGVPQKILDKIFQPFFTTKPTGQGTGLGLSLSYDIVKAHGGELKVKTKENEGSEFIIQLPV